MVVTTKCTVNFDVKSYSCITKKYTWSSASERTQCLKRMKKEIFSNGVDQSDPENLFIQISSRFSADNDSAVWVLGRKVTGDYHVTCDRLTFCALVSHRRSETSEDKFRKITMVRDRGDDDGTVRRIQ